MGILSVGFINCQYVDVSRTRGCKKEKIPNTTSASTYVPPKNSKKNETEKRGFWRFLIDFLLSGFKPPEKNVFRWSHGAHP